MSDSQERPWTNNPNAPRIPYGLYLEEKAYFAGILIASILYGTHNASRPTRPLPALNLFAWSVVGIILVLFFQCMTGLFNSARRGWKGIKWGIISYTVVMFSFATVFTGMNLNVESISYINNREFPGGEGVLPPGPLGYQWFIRPMMRSITSNLTSLLNYWLADGLLVRPWLLLRLSPSCMTLTTPPLAPSLLPGLLHEPLGHRIPLPSVPCLHWCASVFSTDRSRYS